MRQLIKDNLVIVSYFLTIVCVLIIFYAVNGFIKQRRDGLPNLIISIVSYATTTMSLIIALLFLVDD